MPGHSTRLDAPRMQQIGDELDGQLAAATHAMERGRLRLATVTGRTGELWAIPDIAARPLRAAVLPIGSVGDLLRRRPDVVAAELRLEAAMARSGVARAE